MPTVPTIVMICACIIMFVLLIIAISLTIDVFKRIDKLKDINNELNEATKTIVKINKLKNQFEEEVFKFKLLRETKEEKQNDIFINSVKSIHTTGNPRNSNTDNSNSTDYNKNDREN